MKRILIVSLLLTLFALGFSILMALAMPLPDRSMRGQAPSPSASPSLSPSPSPAVIIDGFLDDAFAVTVSFPDEVKTLPLGEYLVGVLGGEMPASFEMEALKAQAVAARTYTLVRILSARKPEHPDADVCSDHTHCQAYLSADELYERWGEEDYNAFYQKIIDAVRATDGLCLTYEGAPIEAVFHSSSAGKTAASTEVWGRALPYLVSVESPESALDVPNYESSVTVSHADFKSTILRAYPNAALGDDPENWIGAKTLSQSGRIDTVIIGGVGVPGTELRTLFGLRSTAIQIELTDTDVVFITTGYGHGVGLSQYGADAMARAGYRYDEILAWYYQGAQLGTIETYLFPQIG
ncbi:MAG TPA: stage II sporulation protein D [Papillibacter sp.]|nr:stage II sporulation protein D [Papillibacter sp.]